MDALDVLYRRAAAMVAHPVEAHELLTRCLELRCAPPHVDFKVLSRTPIRVEYAKDQHLRAVVGLPPECVTGKHLLFWFRAHEYVGAQSTLLEDLRQHGVMAEAIGGVANARGPAEPGHEVALSVETLPHERFASGDVAVRFDPPPAHDHPASLRDSL